MKKNLAALSVIEYLLISKSKTNVALKVLEILKRTEDYYSIVRRYRQFWLSKARRAANYSAEIKETEVCEEEQKKEKSQLVLCSEILEKILESFNKNWKSSYDSVEDWRNHLELQPNLTQESTALYENYYIAEKSDIKSAILDLNVPTEDCDLRLIESVKQVTIKFYKISEKRVYFTDEILIDNKIKQKLETAADQFVPHPANSMRVSYNALPNSLHLSRMPIDENNEIYYESNEDYSKDYENSMDEYSGDILRISISQK